jgi:carboxylate-amine ligase
VQAGIIPDSSYVRWAMAQRYGIEGGFVDESERRLVPFAEVFGNLLSLIAEDIAYFGCEAEIEGARCILGRGTSAIRPLAVDRDARQSSAKRLQAVQAVMDWLIATTRAPGLTMRSPAFAQAS